MVYPPPEDRIGLSATMQRAENKSMPGIWALLRGGQVEGWYTQLQLQNMTRSGQLLPLDLLRESTSGEILPAWKLNGMFPGHGEPTTPVPGTLKAPARLPDYLRKKARGLARWRSRRVRLAGLGMAGLVVSLAGPWAGTSPGIFQPSALGLCSLGFLAAVFLAWPGRFFQIASMVCAGLAIAGALVFGSGLGGWGFWLGMGVCGVIVVAGGYRSLKG